MPEKFVIVDGSSLVHRAFYALDFLSTKDGLHTNAVYGFTRMMLNVIGEFKPTYMVAAFDKSKVTFRNELYSHYKGNRATTPAELSEQFPLAKEIAEALGIKVIELLGYEADDIIGTLSAKAGSVGYEVLIITGDKDALQLVNEHVKVLLTKKGITDVETMDVDAVVAKYEVQPEKLIEMKGLSGDKSDNIPGVPGVGEKTAIKLVKEYGSVENILANVEKISGKKLQENLIANSELALLSKKLAQIDCNVPLDITLEDCSLKPNMAKATEMFSALQFKSMLPKLTEVLQDEASIVSDEHEFCLPVVKTLGSRDEVAVLMRQLKADRACYLYPSLRGKAPDIKLGGFGIATCAENYFVSAESEGWLLFLEVLSDGEIEKITYDAKVIYNAFQLAGSQFKGLKFDILVAEYLINPTSNEYSIFGLAEEYLSCSVKNRTFGDDPAMFSGWAAQVIKEVHPLLNERLTAYELQDLYYGVEQPLIEVLSAMEVNGIRVDAEKLSQMSADIGAKLEVVLAEIYNLAGEEFNVNSPKQLGAVLFEKLRLPVLKKTKTGFSTDAEVLEKLTGQHAIIDKLLEFRMLTKLKSTYLDGLLPLISPKTGRIHTSFNQTVTATGRLSSSEPNLQNIPIRSEIGRKIREVFIPGQGYDWLLSADYSQIELRVLAHISQDENLVDAFIHNQDVHTRTASEVFGVEMTEVTSEMRSKAKAVNFGIVYGISDYGLSRDLGVSRKEAGDYISNYFSRCSGVKQFIDNVVHSARENSYVTTLLGRRRYLPDINSSNFNQRSFAERMAMNTPIQGTAADIIKKAMITVYYALQSQNLRSRILLQVHDELVVEVVDAELAQVSQLIKESMESAFNLVVPLSAEIHYGKSWAEAK